MTTLRQQYESLPVHVLKKTLASGNISKEDAELCRQVIEEKTGEKIIVQNNKDEELENNIENPINSGATFFEKAENWFAIGLIIFFFVPWVRDWYFQGSAYDIAVNLKGHALFLWSIPLLGLASITLGLQKNDHGLYSFVSILAGASPIIAIIWYLISIDALNEIGSDLFHFLSFGAYASIAVGIGLILHH